MADENETTNETDLVSSKPAPKRRKAAAKGVLGRHTEDLRERAKTKVSAYAAEGKDKASAKLDEFAGMIDDTVASLEEKLGVNLGDYAHRAAGAISGFSETLRSKDVEALFDDARSAIRRNPAVAIGAAVAVGFAVARLVKAAGGATDDDANTTA